MWARRACVNVCRGTSSWEAPSRCAVSSRGLAFNVQSCGPPSVPLQDLAQSSWRAATASQMQLRLSKQLTSTGAALGAGAGLSRGGDVGSTADARARAWG